MKSISSLVIKRLFDVSLVALAIPIWLPVLCVIVVVVRCGLGSPVFFVQDRPGYRARIFKLRKFRTMTEAKGLGGELLPDSERQTPLGNWLRSTSLDEIPELVNVLVGEMSLVGPRPLLTRYLEHYTAEQSRRHEVPPGLTGWAQIHGRNAITWEQKFAMDLWYVDHRSLMLDVKIVWWTLVKVMRREGINADGGGMMPEFRGSLTEQKPGGRNQRSAL